MKANPYADVADIAARATALPGAAYADLAVFDAEVRKVLRAGWLPVLRESEVANPGDYRAVEPMGEPVMVARKTDGAIGVFSRVCRHRGMLVGDAAGNARSLTCPYHLWRYDLDGALLTAPAMEDAEGFDARTCGLKPIRHELWGGWIFVNIGREAEPLAPRLAPLEARLAALNPAGMVTAKVLTFESPWNWKVMVENFLESYHHIGTHSTTLQRTNPGLGAYPGEHGALFTILENPAAGPENESFVVAAVFPMMLMFFSEGAPLGVWYELTDLEPRRFELRIHLLAAPELAASAEFVKGFAAQATGIHMEDIGACEGVQRGVTSAGYEPGPLSALEGCLWHFHRHLRECFR